MANSYNNAILRLIERTMSGRHNKRVGLCTSWDPKNHLAKVKFQPEGNETGWLPVHTMSAGDQYGHMTGLTPGDGISTGDQVEVLYQEGNFDTGAIVARIHSDVDKPPPVESGEQLFQSPFSSSIKLANDGSITYTDKAGSIIKEDGTGNITVTATGTVTIKAATIVLNGNVVLGGPAGSGVPISLQGTIDSGGNADISDLATKVKAT